jgi:hypothetical protein
MSRALVALALSFALGGNAPFQWAAALVNAVLSASASTEDGGHEDPNGDQSNSDYGSIFDPNG